MAYGTCTCIGEITNEQREKIREIIEYYKGKSGVLIQALHEAQQIVGYLPGEVQDMIAEGLDVPISEVYGVITFYALFSLKPKGRNVISVCKGTACYVKGVDSIMEKLEEDLGIKGEDTTDDGKFSVEIVRCMGACGLGPVIKINEDIYARVKPDQLREMLNKYE